MATPQMMAERVAKPDSTGSADDSPPASPPADSLRTARIAWADSLEPRASAHGWERLVGARGR